ncbi:AbrB family transcriptional regulator [Methylobacterium sp. A49B]
MIHEARSQTRRQLDRLILPKALVNRLNLQQGQWLHVSELPDGGVRLSPYDPDFHAAMIVVDEIMDEYRDTLRTLAK